MRRGDENDGILMKPFLLCFAFLTYQGAHEHAAASSRHLSISFEAILTPKALLESRTLLSLSDSYNSIWGLWKREDVSIRALSAIKHEIRRILWNRDRNQPLGSRSLRFPSKTAIPVSRYQTLDYIRVT